MVRYPFNGGTMAKISIALLMFFMVSNLSYAVQYTLPTSIEANGNTVLAFEYNSTYSAGGYFTLETSPANIIFNATFSDFSELKLNFVDSAGNTGTTITLDMTIDADGSFVSDDSTGFSVEVDSAVEDIIIYGVDPGGTPTPTPTSTPTPDYSGLSKMGVGLSDNNRVIRIR
jgi:hypothetical protein